MASNFLALFLPTCSGANPSRGGFETEDSAWEYVFAQMCGSCREERRLALEGKPFPTPRTHDAIDDPPNKFPACSEEWYVEVGPPSWVKA
jgi:hypothetical protein